MNLHQLRFVREAVRQNYNLTDAAKALTTSQPGVSKSILELEQELGVDIFERHGKRIRGLTEPGRTVLKSVELIAPVHKKQLLTYLRLADCRLGFLINFGAELIKNGISRVVNNLPDSAP